jgi:hypothetical protein
MRAAPPDGAAPAGQVSAGRAPADWKPALQAPGDSYGRNPGLWHHLGLLAERGIWTRITRRGVTPAIPVRGCMFRRSGPLTEALRQARSGSRRPVEGRRPGHRRHARARRPGAPPVRPRSPCPCSELEAAPIRYQPTTVVAVKAAREAGGCVGRQPIRSERCWSGTSPAWTVIPRPPALAASKARRWTPTAIIRALGKEPTARVKRDLPPARNALGGLIHTMR